MEVVEVQPKTLWEEQLEIGRIMRSKMGEVFGTNDDMKKFTKVFLGSGSEDSEEEIQNLKGEFFSKLNKIADDIRGDNIFANIDKKRDEVMKKALGDEKVNLQDDEIIAEQQLRIAKLSGTPLLAEMDKEKMLSIVPSIKKAASFLTEVIKNYKEIIQKLEEKTPDEVNELMSQVKPDMKKEEIKELFIGKKIDEPV